MVEQNGATLNSLAVIFGAERKLQQKTFGSIHHSELRHPKQLWTARRLTPSNWEEPKWWGRSQELWCWEKGKSLT